MPSSHLIFCHPLLLLSPIPTIIRVFFNESTLPMRWSKYWSFSFSISPSNEHPGQISFRMDWLDLLAVQETLKSLLQHRSSKASILLHSAFFPVQVSHPYMTTGKTIALTRWTFVGKVVSLLFNMLSRFVITFLACPKSISPSEVIVLQTDLKLHCLQKLPLPTLVPLHDFPHRLLEGVSEDFVAHGRWHWANLKRAGKTFLFCCQWTCLWSPRPHPLLLSRGWQINLTLLEPLICTELN